MDNTRKGAGICGFRCLKCRHCTLLRDALSSHGWLPACRYILDEGRRRPCPAGDGCTVYEDMDSTSARTAAPPRFHRRTAQRAVRK